MKMMSSLVAMCRVVVAMGLPEQAWIAPVHSFQRLARGIRFSKVYAFPY
jgi:hypothetical protein